MAVAEEVVIQMKAQVQDALKSFKQVEASLEGIAYSGKKAIVTGDNMASRMGRQVKFLAAQYIGLRTIITGIKFNAFVEQTETAFSVMMGSSEEARQKVEELLQFSLKIPLTFKETIGAARQMLAYGFGADTLVDQLKMMSDIAVSLKIPFGDLAYVYGTLRAQGRAYARDLMQFGMRGIPIYEYLAKVVGVSSREIQKMTAEGKIGFAEVEKAFRMMTSAGGPFANMSEKVMETLTGQAAVFKGVFEIVLGSFTKGVTDELTPALKSMSATLLENKTLIEGLGSVLGSTVGVIADVVRELYALKDLLIVVVVGILAGTLLTAAPAIIAALSGIAAALSAMFFAMLAANPILAGIAVALAAVVALFPVIQSLFKLFGKEVDKTTDSMLKYNSSMDVGVDLAIRRQKELTGEMTSQASALEEASDKFDKLLDQYKKYLAERSKDEGENFFAVIEYERQKKLAWAKEEIGMDKAKYEQAKKMIKEMYDYQRKLAKEASYTSFMDTTRSMFGSLSDKGYKDLEAAYTKQYKVQFDMNDLIAAEYGTQQAQVAKIQDQIKYEQLLVEYGLRKEVSLDLQLELLSLQNAKLTEAQKNAIGYYMTQRNLLKDQEKLIEAAQTELDFSTQFEAKLELINKIYKERLDLIVMQVAAGIKPEMDHIRLKYELEQQLNELYEDRYTTLLNGSDAYWKSLQREIALETQRGNQLNAAMLQGQAGMEGTDVGKILSGGDPLLMIVDSFMSALKSIENVAKVLDPIGTIFNSMAKILEPFLNSFLKPFVQLLESLGAVIGALVSIIITLNPYFQMLRIAVEAVADALTWFYNDVLRKVANGFIDIMNGIIKALNKIPFVNISYLKRLDRITTALEGNLETLTNQLKELENQLDYLKDKLREVYEKEVSSLQDLYEAGAISASAYEDAVKQMYDQYAQYFLSDEEMQYAHLKTLEQIRDEILKLQGTSAATSAGAFESSLSALKNVENTRYAGGDFQKRISTLIRVSHGFDNQLREIATFLAAVQSGQRIAPGFDLSGKYAEAASMIVGDKYFSQFKTWFDSYVSTLSAGGFASGTSLVPSDMLANIHKGEGVIPKDFMTAIRSGELTLGGPKGSGSHGNTVYINIEGSVIRERDLARTISESLMTQGRRGYLPA